MKKPAELFEEHKHDVEPDPELARQAEIDARPDPETVKPATQSVFCKSCGGEIIVTDDPDNWPLQCADCVTLGAKLPKGYEHLKGGPHG